MSSGFRGKRPTKAQADQFDTLEPQVKSFHVELSKFSKSKEMPLSAAKVKMINRVLTQVRDLLADDPVVGLLEPLDDDLVPLYSDGVLILGQYVAAMAEYRNMHWSWTDGWTVARGR
jgi:hypothetical protein